MDAYEVAKALYEALRADEKLKAYGSEHLVLWDEADSARYGWSATPTPTLVWEAGPHEWTVALSGTGGEDLDSDDGGRMPVSEAVADALNKAREAGFNFKPITSFLLGVYRI